ncbi:MAG: molybdenum cofactor guanylyltransferase [Pelistega sp.]|nr:molybdenum cofactor guanylyltransferase [Pelistega sp.]
MNKVAGLILAGGEARRMQGQDKGLVLFQGKPLIEHVIERLRPQVNEIWISANRHLEEYREFGFPVIEDLSEFKGMGPLAGLASLAPYLPEAITHVQLAACDTPFLVYDMTARLLSFLGQAEAQCMATLPALEGHVHQFSSLLVKRQALAHLAHFLRTDAKRRIQGFLDQVHMLPCYDYSFTLEHMRNFNSHDDIRDYLSL